MLNAEAIPFHYREYTEDPLSEAEIRDVLALLGVGPRAVLRKNDKAYKALALAGTESDGELVALMAAHPTLLQRPIGIRDGRAVLGRPHEALLSLR